VRAWISWHGPCCEMPQIHHVSCYFQNWVRGSAGTTSPHSESCCVSAQIHCFDLHIPERKQMDSVGFLQGMSGGKHRFERTVRVGGMGESGPLRAVHLSRHKWPGTFSMGGIALDQVVRETADPELSLAAKLLSRCLARTLSLSSLSLSLSLPPSLSLSLPLSLPVALLSLSRSLSLHLVLDPSLSLPARGSRGHLDASGL